jgi:hypothetical protein
MTEFSNTDSRRDKSFLTVGTDFLQLASSGRQVRVGMRQSMPSSSIDSCAGVSDTAPSFACPAFRWRQPS